MYRLAVIAVVICCVNAQTADSPQELLKKAIALHQAGKLDEAIADYRSLLRKYPDMAQIRSNLGAALAGQGKYAEAIVEYKRALMTHPDSQVELNLALAYYKEGQYTEAIENLEKVHRAAPGNGQATLLLADCYLRAGKNKSVIDLLTPLRQDDADHQAITYLLGTALVRDGQTAKGQVVIDQILKNGDSAEARLLMGSTKLFVNDFVGALADLKKAVDLNPNLPDVYAYYGLALLSSGDQEGARKAFTKELEQDPNNFAANLRMGVVLRQDEDNPAALKYFQHALQVRPGDLGVRYQIASVELAEGHIEEARKELESVLKEAPNFVEAHVSLATIYYREKRKLDGDKERAIVAKLNAAQQANQPAVKAAQ
jgi:tetratricopeptide (TPR) repeat protein